MLRRGDCELNRAAQYLMKIVSQRREQARRVYYGAVFEIKRKSVLKGVAMERREFLKMGTAAGLVSSAKMLEPLAQAEQAGSGAKRIPKRKLGKNGEELSIIGFAGIVVMENRPSFASKIAAEAVDRGVNYFDVSPASGKAQERPGPARQPYRNKVFLPCQQEDLTRDGSPKLLAESLRLLRTDHVD